MSPQRRRWLQRLAALAVGPGAGRAASAAPTVAPTEAPSDAAIRRGRTLQFPRDHGAHLANRTEWWYATGWLGSAAAPLLGIQITFFRSRTGLAEHHRSRFAARQLLFAHAAVLDGAAGRHHHDQRIERWSGEVGDGAGAAVDGASVRLGGWSLHDGGAQWTSAASGREFRLALTLARTQPLLLQGDRGFSRKGPQESEASHYYSEPQLALAGRVTVQGQTFEGTGRAWLDHEWSDQILHPEAVGWDWIGINLFDGSALTAFVLRRRDGSALWTGGSFRAAAQAARSFDTADVQFTPRRRWRSPSSGASYPVQWHITTPAGAWTLRALHDAQELDSRASTGTIYWEGLSELLDAQGQRVGLGYLEMTGYATPIKLG